MKFSVIAFGEILFDIIHKKAYIGGAPLNFICHISKLGNKAAIISSIGEDELGRKSLEILTKNNVSNDLILVKKVAPTGTVDVIMENNEPEYIINENVAWDDISIDIDRLDNKSIECDMFYFGTLAQRTENNRKTLKKIFESLKYKDVFYDINLRQNYYSKEIIDWSLNHTTILKISKDEAEIVCNLMYNELINYDNFVKQIKNDYNIKIILITFGDKGVWVYSDIKEIVPAVKAKLVNSIGAGDSFSAGFVSSYLKNVTPKIAAEFGALVAGYVVGYDGGVPEYSDEFRKTINI